MMDRNIEKQIRDNIFKIMNENDETVYNKIDTELYLLKDGNSDYYTVGWFELMHNETMVLSHIKTYYKSDIMFRLIEVSKMD